MKKFLSIFKAICFLTILVEIFFLGLLVFPGFSALISPNSYINTDYEWLKLFIIALLMFLLLIFLIISIFKNKLTKKTNDKNIIYICTLIILYYVFIVRERILYITNIILLMPIVLTYIYIFLKEYFIKK